MADDRTNLLRAWTHPVYSIPLPGAFGVPAPSLLSNRFQAQVGDTPGYLPAAGIFASMSPEQQFWFHQLMGAGQGGPEPPSAVNPYYMMMLLQGPQGAIQMPGEEEQ